MLKNSKLLGILLSIVMVLAFSVGGFAYYEYSQESGTNFFVSAADKADALEDTNELRQIVDDLGNLLDHSKRDDSYPKDGTTGGTLGTITATEFVGGGAGLTGVGQTSATALTIDAKVNEAGGITKGQPVYFSGAVGQIPQASLADNTVDGKTCVAGIAAETKTDGQTILIRAGGQLDDVDTSSYSDGDCLYLSTAGSYSITMPTSGEIIIVAGVEYSHASQGKLLIAIKRTKDTGAPANTDLITRLGDNAGTYKEVWKDYANNEIASIDSDGKADFNELMLDTALPAIEGGTGKATITDDSYLRGAATNTYEERTAAETKSDLDVGTNIVLCSNYDHPDEAITAISSANKTLLVTEAETCDTNFTVPANVTVKFERGGKWTINNGVAVTFNGQIDVGLWEIFSLTGTGVINFGGGKVSEVFPEWWGIDGTADEVEINQAITAVAPTPPGNPWDIPATTYATVVKLRSGVYNVTDTITIPSYVRVRGSGIANTKLVSTIDNATITRTDIAFVDGGAGADTITTVAGDFDAAGFANGDVVEITGSTDNEGRLTVVGVAAQTLTLATGVLTAEGAGDSFSINETTPIITMGTSGTAAYYISLGGFSIHGGGLVSVGIANHCIRWGLSDIEVTYCDLDGYYFYDAYIGNGYNLYAKYCADSAGYAGMKLDGQGAGFGENAVSFYGGELNACYDGVIITRGYGITFSGCTFEGNDRHGINAAGCSGLAISHCYFEANASVVAGASIWGTISHGHINGCFFTNGTNEDKSIALSSGNGLTISNNLIPNMTSPKAFIGQTDEGVAHGDFTFVRVSIYGNSGANDSTPLFTSNLQTCVDAKENANPNTRSTNYINHLGKIQSKLFLERSIGLYGSTSGSSIIKASAAGGARTFSLPTADGILVTDATECTDLEGTLLSIVTGTLNAAIPEDHVSATMLKDDNAPADQDIYCYEETGATGHWYTPSELNIATSSNKLSYFAATSSSELAGVISDETGTLKVVLSDSPVFTTKITTPIIDLTGGQVAFPATQAPSANANTLDDYEEETYEPTITCSVSGSYTAATNKTLAYTKIGRKVHIQGYLDITSETSPDGNIYVSLPFVTADLTDQSGRAAGTVRLINHGGDIPNSTFGYTIEGVSYFFIATIPDNGVLAVINHNDVDTAWRLYISMTYLTN